MASKKMTAEQKKVDNMIHKINRRLVRMAKSGMELSPVFGAISESILDAGKAASKAEFKASGSTDPDDLKSPFRYTKVTAADGTIINVMQLSRSTWMLNNMTLEMLKVADDLGPRKVSSVRPYPGGTEPRRRGGLSGAGKRDFGVAARRGDPRCAQRRRERLRRAPSDGVLGRW